eukprot:361573_1
MTSLVNQLLLLLPFIFVCHSIDLNLKAFKSEASAIILCETSESAFGSWILINARSLYKLNSASMNTHILIKNIPLSDNRYSIALYSNNIDSRFNLVASHEIDINPNSILTNDIKQENITYYTVDYLKPYTKLSMPTLSTYYTVDNYYVAMTMQNITYNMKQLNMDTNNVPNFETVVRSADNITIYDLVEKWAWTVNASQYNNSIKPVKQGGLGGVQETPSKYGYYCVYQNDPNRGYLAPDCPNAINVITEHAKMLYAAGMTFIVPDNTNSDAGADNINAYIRQIRPCQIILDTFRQLKNSGTNVPGFAMWNTASGTQWEIYVNWYNNPNYTDLIYTGGTEKKIFFIRSDPGKLPPNQTIVEEIENNNGKKDIQCIFMWAAQKPDALNNGTWTYWQPCDPWTSSLESKTECGLPMTKNSYLGSQMSVSFRGASHMGSTALAQPTKLNGRTFQLGIKDCLRAKPDNIHIPSFNEHHCGAHNIGNNYTWTSGLYGDKNGYIYFSENYGTDMSRTFEPSKESGNYYWLLFESCVRVLRLQYYFSGLLYTNNNISICTVENEICCNNLTQYNDVWSFKYNNVSDYILTEDINEVNAWRNNKSYTEICAVAPYTNSSVFCAEGHQFAASNEGHQGPFILYKYEREPYDVGSWAVINISRVAIYRCMDTVKGIHFIANDGSNCDGVTNNFKMERLLGYAAKLASTAMPRRLMRCVDNKGIYYHTIDDKCFENDSKSSLLGYAL